MFDRPFVVWATLTLGILIFGCTPQQHGESSFEETSNNCRCTFPDSISKNAIRGYSDRHGGGPDYYCLVRIDCSEAGFREFLEKNKLEASATGDHTYAKSHCERFSKEAPAWWRPNELNVTMSGQTWTPQGDHYRLIYGSSTEGTTSCYLVFIDM